MPIDLRIDNVQPGTCGWCQKQRDEVFTIAFSDRSFVGPLCKNDLLRAVRMKCPAPNGKSGPAAVPAAAPAK